MIQDMIPGWLRWARRLQAIAQCGLAYAKDPYDRQRYEEVRSLASEMAGTCSAEQMPAVEALFAAECGYATPKVDVRAAVFSQRELLLVQEREDGGWTLPGGWADVGSSPRECVEREVREEAGLEVKAQRLVAVYDRNKYPHPPIAFHVYRLFFMCEITGGKCQTGIETCGVGFFAEHEIPRLSATRTLPEHVARMFEFAKHPEWPTYFD
jgi:ADP-ribose pyrophosphatase YjhB (NUDIX family)